MVHSTSNEAPRCVLVSGCSSGGKSALISALAALGYATVAEPGRRIVAQERANDGTALPWNDPYAFAQRAVAMARSDLETASTFKGPVFFDRGLVDAAVALDHAGGPATKDTLGPNRPYVKTVFLAPPWPEIYVQDRDRPHGFEAAVEEFNRLTGAFSILGYVACPLPKVGVSKRARFVLAQLGLL